MSENPASADWAAARGEKWRGQFAGMEATLEPVNEPLLHALDLDGPCRIADAGCGAGGTTLEILRRAPAGSVVHGFDVSPALIELARSRARSGERSIAFEVADMAAAAPPEAPYDRLVSRFGIMFFENPAGAFANLSRWLAPGGRFAFAAWGPPAENPWREAVRQVVAEIIELPPSDPDAPGPFRYADAGKLLNVLDGAGYGELRVSDWRGAIPIGGGLPAAQAASFAITSVSSFGEMLAQAGEDAVERARQALAARLSRYQRDGAVWMDACVHIFTGARRAAAATGGS